MFSLLHLLSTICSSCFCLSILLGMDGRKSASFLLCRPMASNFAISLHQPLLLVRIRKKL